MRAVRPDAGKTIGLKLHPDLQAIGLGLPIPRCACWTSVGAPNGSGHDARSRAQSHRLGKLAVLAADIASVKASLEILEETRVEVNFLIKGAIERTHSRLRRPEPDWVAPENMTSVGGRYFPRLSENVGPFRLCATKNRGDNRPVASDGVPGLVVDACWDRPVFDSMSRPE